MRNTRSAVLIALLLGASNAAAHADSIYNVNLNSNGATAVGTITTDGTVGILQSGNITGYSITLSNGVNTSTITNGIFYVNGNDLTATSAGLFYNFDDTTTANYAGFAGTDYTFFLCYTGSANCAGTTGSQTDIKINNNYYLSNQTGVQEIASAATPEPSSLALLGTGLLGVYGAARRRFTAA